MSGNNVNIVNTNNWYQKMNTNGTQNITNMVLSGTNPSMQMALISVANDVHYLSSNYQLSKTNGFTLTFQFYITGTSMNSICAYFGVTDPTTGFDPNSGLANQSGAVELRIAPATPIFQLYTNYGTNSIVATSATSVSAGTWQTVTITFTPSATATWVVNYNGTNVISYNDTSFTSFVNNQNTIWGLYGATSNTVSASIRAVDLSVKQSMPMSVLKNIYSFYPEECFINKLSTYSQTNAAAAFGLRLLKADYLGAVINVRRGSDNATLDFFADSKGNVGTSLYGTGQTLLTWLAGSIGYITRWYDQTGNGRDVISTTELLTNGSFAGNTNVSQYSSGESYGSNTIITLANPGDSAYVLQQTGDAEYQMNWTTQLTANSTYTVSGWYSKSSDYNGNDSMLHMRAHSNSGNHVDKPAPFIGNILETRVVGSLTWYYCSTTIITPADYTYFLWFLGYGGNGTTGYRYYTKLSITTTSAQPKIGTPILDTISSSGKSAARGIYCLYRANSTYLGATIRLRRSADNFTSDFYSDVYGNLNNSLSAENAVNTWTARTSNLACQGIAWSPSLNLFAATNYNGGAATTSAIQTSPDGITWTTRTTPSISVLSYIIWAPGVSLFVATAYQAGTSGVLTSPDGINWTQRTTPNIADGISAGLADVTWNGSLFVCVNQRTTANTAWIITSPDGITWTQRTTPSGSNWMGVSWSPQLSLFVAVNNLIPTTSGVATSPDGITWTIRTTPSVSQLSRVRWSSGLNLFVAVGINSCITSPDGINWTSRSVPSGQWGGLVWSSELSIFAATRMDLSTNCVMTSSDGITWTSRVTPSTRCWDIAWNPSLSTFVAVNPLSTTLITSAQGLIANSTYSSWIGSSTSYVDTWYDQSGSLNHATQSTTVNQPVYNDTLKLIDSLNSSSLFLNIPSGTVPTGTLNAPYSFVFKHGTFNNTNGAFIGAGAWVTNQSNVIRLYSGQPNGYSNYWYDNDLLFGTNTAASGNTVAITYTGTVHNAYVNGTLSNTNSSRTGGTTAAGQQYLFRVAGGEYLNGQMYSVFIFGSALSDSDRMACTGNPTDLNIKYDGSASYLYSGTTNLPLTSGLKTYTYVFNGRVDNNAASNSAIDQTNGTSKTANNRAGLLFYYDKYGFCGEGNDALSMIPYSNFVNRKVVMMCNHNLNTGNVTINDNGSIYTATTGSPNSLNVAAGGFTIGRESPSSSEFFTGFINEVIVFRNTLTPKESQIYFTPNAITRKNYRSKPVLQIKDIPKDISPIPSGAIVQLDTQMLLNMSPGGLVTSWNGFTGYNNPVLNAATYAANAVVYNIPPYVSIVNGATLVSATTGQYLDAGSKTFNVNTNGGFTAVWFGAFTNTTAANAHERIFDFGNGQNNDNIIALRPATGTGIAFYMQNGSTQYFTATGSNAIVQNEWAVWTFRYNASSRYMEILKNGFQYSAATAGAAITDKTLTKTWIGRGLWTATTTDYYSNINTAGLYVYDRYLSDAQIASVSNHLMYSTNSNLPNTIPDYNNKVVRYGNITSQGYRGGQAMYFTGSYNTNSYLDIQDIPNWPLSFCFWFNNVNSSGGVNTSPAALCSADLAGLGIQFDITNTGTTIVAAYLNSSTGAYSQFTNSTISLNTWYHVAFTVTPTSVSYYLNGSLVQTVSTVLANTNRLIFGKSGDNGRPYNGYIADIRVYDYALRADEVSMVAGYASQAGQEIVNYNTPTNYLVNMSNWYSFMNTYQTGSFGIASGLTGADVYYRLTGNGVSNSSNTLFNSTRIQNYNSFTCSFLMYIDTAVDHGYYFYCGATSSTTVPTGTAGTAANSSYYFYFSITGTQGLYLFNNQGQQLAYSPISASILNTSIYIPITITYNRSVKNTWTVNIASNDILTFNDSNNTNWVSNIAGDIWGIGARTTTSGMSCYIRRVELSYTPFVNTINTTVNAQNNTKFPPGAMTAASTTFTGTGILDGVYTASQSNGNPINPAYYAFDNNTSTFAIELGSIYAGTSGAYSSSVSTTVTNLITGISTSYSGEWLQLQVPNPVSLNSFSLMGRQDQSLFIWRTPNTFYVAGSNDGTNWELVHSTSGAQFTSAMQYFTCNGGNTKKYRYFRIIINKIGNNGSSGDPSGASHLDITAWDLFTQMNTVNANVIAVPPYSMTADTTTFAGNSLYDGTYTLTSSNTHSHPDMGPRYTIFNDVGGYGNIWSPGQYHNGSGVYVGSTSTTVSGVSQSGEWVQMQLPNPIVLYSFSLNFWWPNESYWAKSFIIAASNDNSTWTNIYDTTTASFVYGTAQTFVVTGSSNAYKYFRLIVRVTSGIPGCEWWILDQWKLYTNASNFNLMKFPPAPLTADSPVTFTTVNQKNWYNVMTYGVTSGGFTPILSQSDPFKQLQLSDGSTSNVNTYCNVSQTPTNYSSFVLSFQLYATNVNSGEFVHLYFGGGGYVVQYLFEIAAYQGIRMNTSSVANPVVSATNWYNSTWNDIRIEYIRGPTNTWTMFFNETQILQYSDPNWASVPGGTWGFQVYNTTTRFNSYIRQLDMTIAPQSLPGNSILSGSYIASASTVYNNNLDGVPSNAFGNNLKNTSMWHTGLNYSSGAYTGAVTTTVSGTSYLGDWIQIQTPNPVSLNSFSIYPRQNDNICMVRSPKNFVMAGSNDNSTWHLLHTAIGVSDWTTAEKYFVCNGPNVASKYTYFRLVVMAVYNSAAYNGPASANSININNLNLYSPITLNNSITPATPKGLLDGLTWKYFDGNSGGAISYYTTNTYTNIGRCVNTTNLTRITNGQIVENSPTYLFSMEIFGYFRATVSGTWTFSLSSDDGSYLWIGPNALVGYTYLNYNIGTPASNTVATYSVTLLAGTYYPIRIHYTKNNLRNANLTFSFTPPGGTQIFNGQGYFFSGTGLDSAFPQESAKIIKDLTNTNKDGIYYILVNGISTPIHCLMNDCYDGGGWMMLMKGTRGNAFQYDANYWTTKNTLNAGDTTRSDADAKYDTFNYSTVKDVLAIWPDIPSTSYTNVYGQNGGSIFVSDGWTWMVNNWNETTRLTPFTGFNYPRNPHQNTTGIFQTYGINNPFRYNGFGNWCSNQYGAYWHGFTGSGSKKIRWGFLFNNETNEYVSSDVLVGIGMGGSGTSYSAGDLFECCGTSGINRSARFELYGR